MIDMPFDRLNPHLSKGYAYVEFESPDDAEKALKHMDGGKWDTLKAPSHHATCSTVLIADKECHCLCSFCKEQT